MSRQVVAQHYGGLTADMYVPKRPIQYSDDVSAPCESGKLSVIDVVLENLAWGTCAVSNRTSPMLYRRRLHARDCTRRRLRLQVCQIFEQGCGR
jgi:hypothetical protein